jgi:type I restriction enzyme M protein
MQPSLEPLGIEPQLWTAADTLRGNVDASEYKHVVLGLLFLKYISDAFEELHARLQNEPGADPEDRDEYLAENVFWVPGEARWSRLRGDARQPTIGTTIDNAMLAIERENQSLRGVLPHDYAREALDKRRLGELVDLVTNIRVGDADSRARDVLGRVYEYFLGRFAAQEGRGAGEFYTPTHVVRLLVEMLEPFKGRVFDPCCGSGGMFVQSERFVEAHGGRRTDISVLGQESNNTTWKLCKMNLAIRSIEGDIRWNSQGSFMHDEFLDLKADFIMANPPFNDSEWGGQLLRSDVRWKYGAPPVGNSNYAWIQHFIHHLSNTGTAGFVLANGSLSVGGVEGQIRQGIIEDDLVDCIVALPGQLFYSTQIPVSLWFISRNRANRSGHTLLIDARNLGQMADRTHRVLTEADIQCIAMTYHSWRGDGQTDPEDWTQERRDEFLDAWWDSDPDSYQEAYDRLNQDGPAMIKDKLASLSYQDVPGFCKDATLEEIRGHGYVLTPGRYVGVGDAEDDGEPFEEKMQRLVATLQEQQEEGRRLDEEITRSIAAIIYGN